VGEAKRTRARPSRNFFSSCKPGRFWENGQSFVGSAQVNQRMKHREVGQIPACHGYTQHCGVGNEPRAHFQRCVEVSFD
jgi:hypothetical protein